MKLTYHTPDCGYVTREVTSGWSEAGRVYGPEYRVAYRLASGSVLTGTRHADRGDLLTDEHFSLAWPRWAGKPVVLTGED